MGNEVTDPIWVCAPLITLGIPTGMSGPDGYKAATGHTHTHTHLHA
jgi:hypothetical protein